MKTLTSAIPFASRRTLVTACLCLSPALASAHPGHYHPPGENDEFDALRANYLHLHGSLEISAACLALAALVIFKLSRKQAVRVAAAVAFCFSLAFIATH